MVTFAAEATMNTTPSTFRLLLTVWLLSGLALGQNQPAAQLPIGVVDLGKVMEAYPKAVQEQKRLDDARKHIIEGYNAERKKLDDLRLQRDAATGSDRDQAELNLDLMDRRLRGTRQIMEADWQEQAEKFVVWFQEDVEAAIAQIAKARNLQLVLRSQGKLSEKESTTNKARAYDRRMVWFASDQIDITPDVIRLLQVPPADPGKATSAAARDGKTDGKADGKADAKGDGKSGKGDGKE
jgi:Skp family chaperone for outer membrane proteins